MPIYEFKCKKCECVEEILMSVKDPYPTICTKCGGEVYKLMSQTTFALKGTGWYVTDYKNNSAASPQGNSTPAAESKPDTPSVSSDKASE